MAAANPLAATGVSLEDLETGHACFDGMLLAGLTYGEYARYSVGLGRN